MLHEKVDLAMPWGCSSVMHTNV